ncbi:MAG: shikimate dehydrogenase [Thermodesulfovibrionales bacterium]|nr:shikimate dehydrogenase [Thermodesulfovibrionales bacterium]
MIKGSTDIYCIFGHPVRHSKSPLMHNRAFHKLGIDACYVAFDVTPANIGAAIQSVKALNIKGLNITVPHKEVVIPLLDEVNSDAMEIGAVNTIKNEGGSLIGYNTDYKGFIKSLQENDILIKDKNFLILGAGGAARAVIYGLIKEGAKVHIYNRTIEKAKSIVKSFDRLGNISIVEKLAQTEQCDVIVNTTSLGLKKDDSLPINASLIQTSHVVYDTIYFLTPFLEYGQKIGCKIIDGKDMLLWQAVYAFEIWFGIKPPVLDMKEVLYL